MSQGFPGLLKPWVFSWTSQNFKAHNGLWVEITLNLFSFTYSIDLHLRLLSEISLIFALYPRRDICGNLMAPLWGISDVQKPKVLDKCRGNKGRLSVRNALNWLGYKIVNSHIGDTSLILTAAKSQAKLIYRHLTEINFLLLWGQQLEVPTDPTVSTI